MDPSTLNNPVRPKIENINCKVELKHVKIGRHLRTYVSGLHQFMNKEELKEFVHNLKKKLGAGMDTKDTDIGAEYGFQGDHKDQIKELMIASKKVTKEDFLN